MGAVPYAEEAEEDALKWKLALREEFPDGAVAKLENASVIEDLCSKSSEGKSANAFPSEEVFWSGVVAKSANAFPIGVDGVRDVKSPKAEVLAEGEVWRLDVLELAGKGEAPIEEGKSEAKSENPPREGDSCGIVEVSAKSANGFSAFLPTPSAFTEDSSIEVDEAKVKASGLLASAGGGEKLANAFSDDLRRGFGDGKSANESAEVRRFGDGDGNALLMFKAVGGDENASNTFNSGRDEDGISGALCRC